MCHFSISSRFRPFPLSADKQQYLPLCSELQCNRQPEEADTAVQITGTIRPEQACNTRLISIAHLWIRGWLGYLGTFSVQWYWLDINRRPKRKQLARTAVTSSALAEKTVLLPHCYWWHCWDHIPLTTLLWNMNILGISCCALLCSQIGKSVG